MEQQPATPSTASQRPTRDEFDEEGYLLLHPDVAAAVATGAVGSGWQHFTLHGLAEGRPWLSQADRMLGVSAEIAPDDEMFLGDRQHYFDVGDSALRSTIQVRQVLMAVPRGQAVRRGAGSQIGFAGLFGKILLRFGMGGRAGALNSVGARR